MQQSVRKALVIVGTRPEAIKVAPVIRAMKQDPRFNVKVCATGQHDELLYQVLDWFNISPDYRLRVMEHKQPLALLASKLLNGLQQVIEKERPDVVIVQGDTTTTFIGALAAYYGFDYYIRRDIPAGARTEVAHIEAGLRTHDNYAPFPEEGNRRIVSQVTDWHFAPTQDAADVLAEEKITSGVHITGNTVIDALFETTKLLAEKPRNPVPQLNPDKKMVLVTAHRRENYGEGFERVFQAIRHLADTQDIEFVYPVHLNRHVRDSAERYLMGIDNIHLIEPQDYPNFVSLMQQSHLILSDSGGVQEEAPSLGKPVLVLRDVTERMEAAKVGTVKLVGTNTDKIITEAETLLASDAAYQAMSQINNPYGDGHASERILNILAGDDVSKNTFIYKKSKKAA